MRRALTAAVVASALAAAAATDAAPAGRHRQKTYRVGPLQVSPSLRVAAGVDTNVFNQPIDPVPDSGFVVSPSASARWPLSRRLRLEGTGGLAWNYYRREASERFLDRWGEARAEVDVRRFTVFGRVGGGQFRERFTIEIDERVLRQEGRAGAGVSGPLTQRLHGLFEYVGESYRFGASSAGDSSGIRDALDRNTRTARLELTWTLTRRTRAVARVEQLEDEFRVPRASGRRGIPSTRLLAGVESGPKTLLNGRLLAGVRHFPGLGFGTDATTVPILSAAFALRLGDAVTLAVTADRDVNYSAEVGTFSSRVPENAYAYGSYRVEARALLPFDLLARGYVGTDRSRYLLPLPGETSDLRADQRMLVGGGLLRTFGPSMRVGAYVDYSRRRSVVPGFSSEGWRYGLELLIEP